MKVLITGGAGFIGSAVIRMLIAEGEHELVNRDALTYAGNLESLEEISNGPTYRLKSLGFNCEMQHRYSGHRDEVREHWQQGVFEPLCFV